MGFGISGTTVAMLAVMALTTPLQSAGEEIMFKGTVVPAAASWFRVVRPTFLTGLVVSGLLFAAVHGAGDPWLNGYYLFFSASTALMGLITRGLEAAIAFHIAAVVVAVPLYLRRPLAAAIATIALTSAPLVDAPDGLAWLGPALALKLVAAHAVREEPYRPAAVTTHRGERDVRRDHHQRVALTGL